MELIDRSRKSKTIRTRYQWHCWNSADSQGERGKPAAGFPDRVAIRCRRGNAGEWNWWWSAMKIYGVGNTGKNPRTRWRYEWSVSFPVHTSHQCCVPVVQWQLSQVLWSTRSLSMTFTSPPQFRHCSSQQCKILSQ